MTLFIYLYIHIILNVSLCDNLIHFPIQRVSSFPEFQLNSTLLFASYFLQSDIKRLALLNSIGNIDSTFAIEKSHKKTFQPLVKLYCRHVLSCIVTVYFFMYMCVYVYVFCGCCCVCSRGQRDVSSPVTFTDLDVTSMCCTENIYVYKATSVYLACDASHRASPRLYLFFLFSYIKVFYFQAIFLFICDQ